MLLVAALIGRLVGGSAVRVRGGRGRIAGGGAGGVERQSVKIATVFEGGAKPSGRYRQAERVRGDPAGESNLDHAAIRFDAWVAGYLNDLMREEVGVRRRPCGAAVGMDRDFDILSRNVNPEPGDDEQLAELARTLGRTGAVRSDLALIEELSAAQLVADQKEELRQAAQGAANLHRAAEIARDAELAAVDERHRGLLEQARAECSRAEANHQAATRAGTKLRELRARLEQLQAAIAQL